MLLNLFGILLCGAAASSSLVLVYGGSGCWGGGGESPDHISLSNRILTTGKS